MNTSKKLNKEFALTDSTVNCYGFRMLTAGYQISEYERNPIGYYMHDRSSGVLVKWENLKINGDTVFGVPVINMMHARARQTIDEIESGFLNAASVGHIIILETSDDSSLKLPSQDGPTITKWYNRECSIVDIPGNANSLALFDINDTPLTLLSLKANAISRPKLGVKRHANQHQKRDELFGRLYCPSDVYLMSWTELHKKGILSELKLRNFERFKEVFSNEFGKDYTS